MFKTLDQQETIFSMLKEHGYELKELKGADLYCGRGDWKEVDGGKRHELYKDLLKWMSNRMMKIIISGVDLNKFKSMCQKNDKLKRYDYLVWQYLHIVLAIHKKECRKKKYKRKEDELRPKKNNKGKTIFIIDQLKEHEKELSNLLSKKPSWVDQYFSCKVPDEFRLCEIVDTAYFVRSHQANLIQLADLVAYVVRRYAELKENYHSKRFEGELEKINNWYNILEDSFIRSSHVVRKRSKNVPLAEAYKKLRPESLMY